MHLIKLGRCDFTGRAYLLNPDYHLRTPFALTLQSNICKVSRQIVFAVFAFSLALCGWAHAQKLELKNNRIVATFGPRGLTSIRSASSATFSFSDDQWSLLVDQDQLDSENVLPQVRQLSPQKLLYSYPIRGYEVQITYSISHDWDFIAKQLAIVKAPAARYTVHSVETLCLHLVAPPESIYVPETYLPQMTLNPAQSKALTGTFDFGAFLRYPENGGLMLTVQNPFLRVLHDKDTVRLDYRPEMEWQQSWGSFPGDIACVGPYRQTGQRLPSRLTFEWTRPPSDTPHDGADEGEIAAFSAAVRAFLMHPTLKPISVEVAWTLNDYQVDIATAAGRDEYKRIVDATSALGIKDLVYTGTNSDLANPSDDTDSWHDEHLLWLDLGQKIREGKWNPESEVLPQSIREMLAYARIRNVGLLAYVYPSVPFAGNPSWIVAGGEKQSKLQYATLASRSLQDMLIQNLITFKRRTGIAGYSFDYTFLNLSGSSAYAQWWGWRRVIEALRRAEPEIVIDGRWSYLAYGPWTWLAGNYPHPLGGDEQPESFTPYPDLHFDRVSADRLRYVNYWYRNYQFAPEVIVPGFAFHQTERMRNLPHSQNGNGSEEHVELVNTSYRARDWDQLGFQYSLLSSIATAGWNNVINMIPARDSDEARAFRIADQQWIRKWLEWAADHKEYLLRTRDILGQPAMGKLDGTSAIIANHGYLFLFNPNYKCLTADVPLDRSIGLDVRGAYSVEEIYPQNEGRVGKPGTGLWNYADHLKLSLDGASVIVLEIKPFSKVATPILFNAASSDASAKITLTAGTLRINHVAGHPGTKRVLGILLPAKSTVRSVEVNGRGEAFTQEGNYLSVPVHFAGTKFSQSEEIELSSSGTGDFDGSFTIPSRVLKQLAARRTTWPVKWSEADYETTWLVPERLLLFVQFADPEQSDSIQLLLDDKPVSLQRAYSSVRIHGHSFVGWYADFSRVAPDISHQIRIEMPTAAFGRFQGVFFDNVQPEWTEALNN